MTNVPPLLLLPRDGATRVADWTSWGLLNLKTDADHSVALVAGVTDKKDTAYPIGAEWSRRHYLHHADTMSSAGVWYHVEPDLHDLHDRYLMRGAVAPIELVRDRVVHGWLVPPTEYAMPMLGVSVEASGPPRWCCWWLTRDRARPGVVEVVAEDHDPTTQLREDGWPVDLLAGQRVVVVGAGSVGGFAADALAGYGVGAIDLVDYDRLRQRNLPRHLATDADLGRHKVDIVAAYLTARWPALRVRALPISVIHHADIVRPLLDEAALVLAAPDGVAARRATNHLSWRAGVPVVFACVLDAGSIGEVLRLRRPTGCLLCHRAALADTGTVDFETTLDRPYGDGARHLPMTAPGGDLRLVGELAAKAVVATLLEQGGLLAHRLPGDHAVIGLQPPADLQPPFDVRYAAEVAWRPAAVPRPGCPTCGTPA